MANIVVRAPIVWLYLHICRPVNFFNFPLDVYMYGGQTTRPNDRQLEHFEEEKKNPKYAEMLKLVPIEYWEFYAWPIFRHNNETDEQYYNRASIKEKKLIRDLQLCYCTLEYDSPHGLNASVGGESSLNSGWRTSIPGQTSGLKNVVKNSDRNSYRYKKNIRKKGKIVKTKHFYSNKNLFLVFLYMKFLKIENIIVDENIFWDNVFYYWNNDIYNTIHNYDYLGIKRVQVNIDTKMKRNFAVSAKSVKYKKNFYKASFANFLQLYQDGILDVNDIYCLDFFIWNAKLILEGKFDIKNSRPDVFYDDFFKFRKIHHFTVDNLEEAIKFLRVLEDLSDLSIPVGQQRLQFN